MIQTLELMLTDPPSVFIDCVVNCGAFIDVSQSLDLTVRSFVETPCNLQLDAAPRYKLKPLCYVHQ